MKRLLLLIAIFSIGKLHAQNRQYIYYLNNNMQIVDKEQASIVARGAQRDSVFLVRFYTLPDNRLFQTTTFLDSTLSTLHGSYLSYHENKQKATHSYYRNNMLYGSSMRWDSLGRVTDSSVFFEDMPLYKIKYTYIQNGDRKVEYEFDRTYSRKRPGENAVVYAADGSILPTVVWQNLLYGGKYAIKQDKTSPEKYLVYKLSDNYFNQTVAGDKKPEPSAFFKAGEKFVIDERDINNNRLRSKDLLGKVLVINYWFINCKPCRMEMPDLNELVKEYKDSANVKFIAIGLDDKGAIKDFLELATFDYQIVADGRSSTEKYGVTSFPTHVIVDKAGKVYFHTVSSPRQLMYWMRKTINELLSVTPQGVEP